MKHRLLFFVGLLLGLLWRPTALAQTPTTEASPGAIRIAPYSNSWTLEDWREREKHMAVSIAQTGIITWGWFPWSEFGTDAEHKFVWVNDSKVKVVRR